MQNSGRAGLEITANARLHSMWTAVEAHGNHRGNAGPPRLARPPTDISLSVVCAFYGCRVVRRVAVLWCPCIHAAGTLPSGPIRVPMADGYLAKSGL